MLSFFLTVGTFVLILYTYGIQTALYKIRIRYINIFFMFVAIINCSKQNFHNPFHINLMNSINTVNPKNTFRVIWVHIIWADKIFYWCLNMKYEVLVYLIVSDDLQKVNFSQKL